MAIDRVITIVLDSVGCGHAPDADEYGDRGSDTFGDLADAVGGLDLPMLTKLGLGHTTEIEGVPPLAETSGAHGAMTEASAGKDSVTGHWEMAGLRVEQPFKVFTDLVDSFPPEILEPFAERTGRGFLANKHASGTEIIKELGEEHRRTGKWIVYTSADSVFQIAAHEDTIPVEELYEACEIAREIVTPFYVARTIARPFIGDNPSDYERTYNRHDFCMKPTGPTMLDRVKGAGLPVVGIGKIDDLFAGVGLTEGIHTAGNTDGLAKTIEAMDRTEKGLIYVNLVDFDTCFGHRRDDDGYYQALREVDSWLSGQLIPSLRPGRDVVMITADHGNDPVWRGSDHTRERVPILAFGPETACSEDLGIRDTYSDLAATVVDVFDLEPMEYGTSFLNRIT